MSSGLIVIPIKKPSLFNEYVLKHHLADYETGNTSGQGAVREACELMIGLNCNYETVITERKNFSELYTAYLSLRKATTPIYYANVNGVVSEVKP